MVLIQLQNDHLSVCLSVQAKELSSFSVTETSLPVAETFILLPKTEHGMALSLENQA